MCKPYYLKHGVRLDSDHDTLEGAKERACYLVKTYGQSHSQIEIGRRSDGGQILFLYKRQQMFVPVKVLES
jgi:hypothetical protein